MSISNTTASTVPNKHSSCTYRFMPSSLAYLPPERDYNIKMRQQPQLGRVCSPFERDRRQPVDPPPILQLEWINCSTEAAYNSPFYFCMANLLHAEDPAGLLPSQDLLCGSTVSSLYRLRDIDDTDAGFFVFSDLIVLRAGYYRLHFSLFEIVEDTIQNRKTILSDPFVVHTPKLFPGPIQSTFLSRTFSDQGVKIRVRKHSRMENPKKRKAYELDANQNTARYQSQQEDKQYRPQLDRQQQRRQQPLHDKLCTKVPPIMLLCPPYTMPSPPPESYKLPPLRAIIGGHVYNNERVLPPLAPRPL